MWGSFFRGSAATMPWGDMLFVGWPRERLSELIPMHGKKLVGFAGAAFSGFSLLPVIASALYGAGKLGITGDPAQELQSTCDPKTVTRVDNEDAGKEEKGPTSKDKKDKGQRQGCVRGRRGLRRTSTLIIVVIGLDLNVN